MALWRAPGAAVAVKSLFTMLRYGRNAKLSVFRSYRPTPAGKKRRHQCYLELLSAQAVRLHHLRRIATQLLPVPEVYLNVTETSADDNSDAPRKVKEVALSMPLSATKVHFTRDGEA